MKRIIVFAAVVTGLVLLSACSSTPPKTERGPQGTIAYYVQVETSEPGVRIEANNDYVGNTPCTLKLFGDPDGTFHNFGTYEYIVRAYPLNTNQSVQTKVFHTGGWFRDEDTIPKRIYFDMSHKLF
jgi:hypothetical protein